MGSFLSFVALALARVVVSSPSGLGMGSVLEKRYEVDCSDFSERAFISAS